MFLSVGMSLICNIFIYIYIYNQGAKKIGCKFGQTFFNTKKILSKNKWKGQKNYWPKQLNRYMLSSNLYIKKKLKIKKS